jgi:hypothetical protein
MVKIETTKPAGCRLDQVTVVVCRCPPARFYCAGFEKRLVDTQLASLGSTPREHTFAPYTVPELWLALEDDNICGPFGKSEREARTVSWTPKTRQLVKVEPCP